MPSGYNNHKQSNKSHREPSRKSKGRSRSSSCERNERDRCKSSPRHHSPKHSNSSDCESKRTCSPRKRSCSPRKRSCSPKGRHDSPRNGAQRNRRHSNSSSSGSDCGSPRDWDKLYCHYKNELLEDPTLEIGGSDCYGIVYSTNAQTLELAAPVVFNNNQILHNVDHTPGSPDVYVRRDGMFLMTVTLQPQEAVQFSVYINGLQTFENTAGTLNAAGQLITRYLVALTKDDVITIRNKSSSISTVHILELNGAVIPGITASLVLVKVAPFPYDPELLEEYDGETVVPNVRETKRQHKLNEKIERKLLCDESLMIAGSDSYGAYWSTAAQTVQLEAPVLWQFQQNVHNQCNVSGTGDVKVEKDGIYYFVFLASTVQPAQFTVFVNGIPNTSTTTGINKGANQIQLREEIALHCGDIVSVVNHTSAFGPIVLQENPGGALAGALATFILFKIAPLPDCQYESKEVVPRLEKHSCEYLALKKHLLCEDNLMARGSDCYFYTYCVDTQSLNVGDKVNWIYNGPMKNVYHPTGSPCVKVKKSGIYKIFFDIKAGQPAQFTIFVNGVPNASTISGTDSGSGLLSIRQLLALKCGDELSVVNWKSVINPVISLLNPGGLDVGISITFLAVKIANLKECRSRSCSPKHCSPRKCSPRKCSPKKGGKPGGK